MADYFIDVNVVASEEELAERAVERLQEQWVVWEPSEGDLEVVLIEALAHMAADAAMVAGVMPGEAFQTILEDLFGVPRNDGVPSSGTVTFTLVDTDPHVIEAGTEVDIDGWAFTVNADTPVSGSLTVSAVPVTAVEVDLGANGLPGDLVVMVSASAFIADVALDAPTGGGTAPETDDEYRDKGSRQLELQALTLVTARDYELMALTVDGVGRVTTTSNLSTRTVVVTASAADGTALAGGASPPYTDGSPKDQLMDLFQEYRQTTWTVSIADPTITTINVTFQVHVYPGFETSGVLAEAALFVGQFLDPATWGLPSYARTPATDWQVEPRVRANKLIDVIGSTHGVDYVNSVTITGSAGSVQSNGDWLMPGTVPLPKAGTIAGTIV